MSHEKYDLQILHVCQTLHGHNCGSGDPIATADVVAGVNWLRMRIDGWGECRSPYEEAVRALVVATINETEADL